MDKMCELAKAVSDLKLTRNEIRKGLSGFEVLTISKRCKSTVNETYNLIDYILEKNMNLKILKNKGDNNNEIWSIRNGKRKQQKGFEGKGRKKIKEQNQEIV